MSQQVDANLVELARKWLGKMMPYARFDEQVFGSTIDVCLTSPSFLWSLVNYGCKVIAVSEHKYAYFRCGGKLVRVEIYCREIVEDIIGGASLLSERDEQKLADRKPSGGIHFEGTGINLSIFGDELVYLGTLKNIPLYLRLIELFMYYPMYRSSKYGVDIYVSTASEGGGMRDIAVVTYSLKGDKIEREIFRWETEVEEAELVKKVLPVLNEKYLIMDDLLREATEIFTRGFKNIAIAVLY